MRRRDFLTTVAGGIGATALLGSFGNTAWAADTGNKIDSCLIPWDSSTKMVSWPKKDPPYSIALSNSYIGNTWRSEMVSIAKLYSERDDVKPLLKDFTISSAGNNVSAQIAQINQMILKGVDAIIVEAANPTGLNSTIDRAVDAGIAVVSFDAVVTTKKAVIVNEDQFKMGKRWAEFVVKHMGKKGQVLMVRGVAGTSVDNERFAGGMSVFKQYPDIETTQVYGKWDSATAQKVTADALAAKGGSFDGIWSEGGDDGIIRAFLHAGAKLPLVAAGEAENGFRKQAVKYKFPILSIGQSAALSAVSMAVALQMLQGHKVARSIKIPFVEVTNADLKEGVNYFDDLPSSFYDDVRLPVCGLNFDAHKVLSTKV